MGKGGFSVTITAVDKATGTIKSINDALARFTKPIQQTQTAFAKLAKETGLDQLTKSLGGAGRAAVTAAERLGAFGASAGSLAGAGSIGGLALLARQWGEVGIASTNTAYRIGISTGALGQFQAAARLGGVAAEAMTAGVEGMAKNIGDVLSGRNATMAGYFQLLGIRARYAADGTADVATAFRDIRKALAAAPTAQGKNAMLEALGIPVELRPIIENMDQLSDSARRARPNFGAATAGGAELGKALARLGENVAGIGDTIEIRLGPGLLKAITLFGDVAEKINNATAALGGWSHVLTIATATGGGALAGAAGGAAIGMLGGPVGAFGGALIGGASGFVLGGGLDAMGTDTGTAAVLGGGAPRSASQMRKAARTGIPSVAAAAIKWNNPANLRASPTSFQTFATPEEGLGAAARNLVGYQTRHGLTTLGAMIARWAPPSENDTGRYIQSASEATGLNPNEPIDFRANPGAAAGILASIVKNEQGRQPFTPEQYAAAVASALGQAALAPGQGGGQVSVTVTAPPGSSVAATSSSPYWPVRVQYGLTASPATP